MRNLLCLWTVLVSLSFSPSVIAQTYDDGPTAAYSTDSTNCRAVVGQADIDGTPQQIVGRACLQADGTWQYVQDADGSVLWYPLAAYPYPDPWWWGAPIFIGVGVRFIFIDRFHHHHRFNYLVHVRPLDHRVNVPAGMGFHHGAVVGGGMHGSDGMRRH
jgi:surface antigen